MVIVQTIKELSACEFQEFTKEGVVLVDFFADWCMSCLMMDPVLEDLCEKFGGRIKIGKINVEENKQLSEKLHVSSIPKIFLFSGGQMKKELTGSISGDELEEMIKSYVN